MKEYVLGFVFNEALSCVALILKNKPAWQAGRLNGIGGKVEFGESPILAMQRECREELSLDISEWIAFANFHGADDQAAAGNEYIVRCFTTTTRQSLAECHQSVTDEGEIRIQLVESLNGSIEKPLNNVNWLVPMAIEAIKGHRTYYSICELEPQL